MTTFEQFIFVYFVSATALAGIAILWRNWLEDHLTWKVWLSNHLGAVSNTLTCGSCFTFWIALCFVLMLNPLQSFFSITQTFGGMSQLLSWTIQWMTIAWGALFLRFLYVLLQQGVSGLVHRSESHHR
jgi:hypothetical protein